MRTFPPFFAVYCISVVRGPLRTVCVEFVVGIGKLQKTVPSLLWAKGLLQADTEVKTEVFMPGNTFTLRTVAFLEN